MKLSYLFDLDVFLNRVSLGQQGEDIHGVVGLVNLFGIESPGLTSSLAIAEYVAARFAREIK